MAQQEFVPTEANIPDQPDHHRPTKDHLEARSDVMDVLQEERPIPAFPEA